MRCQILSNPFDVMGSECSWDKQYWACYSGTCHALTPDTPTPRLSDKRSDGQKGEAPFFILDGKSNFRFLLFVLTSGNANWHDFGLEHWRWLISSALKKVIKVGWTDLLVSFIQFLRSRNWLPQTVGMKNTADSWTQLFGRRVMERRTLPFVQESSSLLCLRRKLSGGTWFPTCKIP